MTVQARVWLPPFRLPEKLLAAAAVLWIASWFSASAGLQLVAWIFVTIMAVVVSIRVGRFYISKLIWRLRNRLLVAFLFIAVIPIGLVIALGTTWVRAISGQFAVHLARMEMDNRLHRLNELIDDVERVPAGKSFDTIADLWKNASVRFTGLSISVSAPNGRKYNFGEFPAIKGPADQTGLFVINGKLFGGAFRHDPALQRDVAVLAPLDREFFGTLAPSVGVVSLLPGGERTFALHDTGSSRYPTDVGPPSAWWDVELLRGTQIPVTYIDSPEGEGFALLAVRSRMANVVSILFSQANELGSLLPLLYLLAALILTAEIVSLFLGFSISRTITAAVHELYEGTERVMRGDFTHRIPVRGSEQIADLSRSFNTMTENVERLLKVSKENERMQAELEIARRVQQQLFPSQMPHVETLEIRAVCQPARQVSGDYYDYQSLGNGKLVLALGDVAGKGISAALLMASLQSTLRVQLREWQSDVSTERLVTGLNQHLFLNTTPEKYATFFLALYDEATGILEYTNAGHLPPLLIRAGTVTRLDVNGMVVGAFSASQYDSSRLQLQSGDLLVCYTDGVTELENEFSEQFGEERLSEVLLRAARVSLDQVESAVLDAAAKFSGSPEAQDDLTMLMLRRT